MTISVSSSVSFPSPNPVTVCSSLLRNFFPPLRKFFAAGALHGVALGPATILTLSYCGELREFAYGDRICDFWLGPTADRVYHFPRPSPDEPDSGFLVGRPPLL